MLIAWRLISVRRLMLAERLPISIQIEGLVTQFDCHPQRKAGKCQRDDDAYNNSSRQTPRSFLKRQTPDGYTITFGLGNTEWRRGPGMFGWLTLAMLLDRTALAFVYVRRLFKPLDDIGAGVQRFGAGNCSQPIALARADELSDLAGQINTMGQEIAQMLVTKRALLLAISHELRSPLTRARLNTELLPDSMDTQETRQALLRDLVEMARLITDLLESERLSINHAALNLELTDFAELVKEASETMPNDPPLSLNIDNNLPMLQLDRTRIKLLLRNLLDNAQRHGQGPIDISLFRTTDALQLTIRDYGPGIPVDQ